MEARDVKKSEINQGRREIGPAFVLGVTLVVIVLLMTCALGGLLLRRLNTPRPTPTPEILSMLTSLPTAIPVTIFEVHLPIIRSSTDPNKSLSIQSVTPTEPVWKVSRVKRLGYNLNGKRYDVAIFRNVVTQDTARGYCIDQGLDVPEIGTEYLLNENGVFVPLDAPSGPPIQRFLRYRK